MTAPVSPAAERWAPIPGREDFPLNYARYEVSTWGRIRVQERRLSNGRIIPAHLLKPTLNKRRYPTYQFLLGVGGGGETAIHRLMARIFIPNPEGYPLVRHLNDLPLDNRIENLAWGTPAMNVEDARRNRAARKAAA